MATTPVPEPQAQASINHFGRIIGSFYSPKQTFADIAQRPSWVAPLLLMVILGTAVGAMLNAKMNWGDYIRQQAEKNSRFAQLSEEQKESALGSQIKYAKYFSYSIGILNTPVILLLFALIYWGAFNLFCGANLRYGASFGITAHAFLPLAIQSVLALIILPLKSYGDVDPQNLVATNVGAFLSDDAPKWLASLGGSLDLFWLWFMALVAIGFAAANPKRIKPGAAFGTVFGLWGIWVLAKVAWAAL
jgi:hypothetical protein